MNADAAVHICFQAGALILHLLQTSSLHLGVLIFFEFARHILSIHCRNLSWSTELQPSVLCSHMSSPVLTLGRLLHLSGTGYLHLDLQLTMLVAGILKFGTKIVTIGKARVHRTSLPTLDQHEVVHEILGKYLAVFNTLHLPMSSGSPDVPHSEIFLCVTI